MNLNNLQCEFPVFGMNCWSSINLTSSEIAAILPFVCRCKLIPGNVYENFTALTSACQTEDSRGAGKSDNIYLGGIRKPTETGSNVVESGKLK